MAISVGNGGGGYSRGWGTVITVGDLGGGGMYIL